MDREVVEVGEHGERVVDFLDVLLVLSRRRKFLAIAVLGSALSAVLIAFMLPSYFEARTSLMPPQTSQLSNSILAGQMTALTGLSPRDLGVKNPSDLYIGLLSSETVRDRLVARFGLAKIYGSKRMVEARMRLAKLSVITSGKDGLISVVVQDRDPRRAADLANGYVEELQSLNKRLAFTEAGQRRLFFDEQLEATKARLIAAEADLGDTQKRTGVLELEANAKALVEQIGFVRSQLAAKEVEVQAMRRFMTAQNPELKRAAEESVALRKELAKLESGAGEGESGSTGKLSGAGVEYVKKLREVKYQETLFEVLSRQFEAARLDEAKESSTVQVVDRATVPEKRSSPRRGLLVAVVTLFGSLASIVGVLVEGSVRRAMQDPEREMKLEELRNSWRVSGSFSV